jgi:hypothetical protein
MSWAWPDGDPTGDGPPGTDTGTQLVLAPRPPYRFVLVPRAKAELRPGIRPQVDVRGRSYEMLRRGDSVSVRFKKIELL